MTTYNTGNPIGSTDSRDRLDNTENMDYLENSTTELTHADRLGTVRKTRHGMEVEHDAQIAAHELEHDAQIAAHEVEHDNQMQSFETDFDGRLAGMAFTRVGSFTAGATLTDMRQVLVWEISQGGDGHEYGWAGTFPKVVAAGATPATSGGIGAGAWVDRTQETLRSELHPTGLDENIIALGADPTATVSSTSVIREKLNVDGELIVPKGKYLIDSDIVITGKDISILCHPEAEFISTNGSGFGFWGTSGTEVACNDVAGGDIYVTSSISVSVGDWVRVSGTIAHALYTPNRYTRGALVAKVYKIDGTNIYLDRRCLFSFTSVTISKLAPISVKLNNFNSNGVGVDIKLSNKFFTNVFFKGEISSPIQLQDCSDGRINFLGEDLHNTLRGLTMNNCSQFVVDMIGTNIGNYLEYGSKTFRGNGLQNGIINLNLESSPYGDCTIYGSRHLTVNVTSTGAGRYYREYGIESGNRTESVQFSECDNIDLTANITNVDDQAIELLMCYRCVVKPKVNTLSGATEGAMVIKGGSTDITILNPVIRAYNNYGIKIEPTNPLSDSNPATIRTNNIHIINPDLDCLQYGVYVEDPTYVTNHDVNLSIDGGKISSNTNPPLLVKANNRVINIQGTRFISNGSAHAVESYGDYLTIDNIICDKCNDITKRAVVSSGANDVVSNVHSSGAIYVTNEAQHNFALSRYPKNNVSRLYLPEDNFSFYPKNGGYAVSTIPTLYKWSQGDLLHRYQYSSGAELGYVCVNSGEQYLGWAATTSYTLGRKVYLGTHVYVCTAAGVSGSTGPTGTGTGITDGSVTWDYVKEYDTFSIMPFGIARKRVIGQATIAAGGTSVVVTHNLGLTPVAWGMSPNANLSGGMWATTLTTTQMTIFIPSALGSTLTITYWVEG